MPVNQWFLVFFRTKKSISALLFTTKVPIFAPDNTESGVKHTNGYNILSQSALKIFQFIGLCKKQ
jgi:hypothetical protein